MKKMKKKSILLIVVVWALFVFSACGGKEKPETEPEDSWLAKINKLAVETVIERSDENGTSVESGELEIVIKNIHPGSFSQKNANEIFLDCWFKGMPHVGGLDSRAGILLNPDTLEVIAYKEFEGDGVVLDYLQTAKGQCRILSLRESAGQGHRGQFFEIWGVRDGEWVEFPAGIEDFIPDEKKGDVANTIKEPVLRIEDSFCYVLGDRLAVTYEQDWTIMQESGIWPPSELVAILTWNPYKERFELDEHVEQPAVQQTQPDRNEALSH